MYDDSNSVMYEDTAEGESESSITKIISTDNQNSDGKYSSLIYLK